MYRMMMFGKWLLIGTLIFVGILIVGVVYIGRRGY